jgi:lipopolysaccharide transport system permease protein
MARVRIRPDQPWWQIAWKEIWEYRDLLRFLILRDLTATYKQSILGPIWFILQPLAMTVVFTVIFGNIARLSTDGTPPFLFYFCSMVLWNYFQGCINTVSGSLVSNAGVLGKVYFPRLIVPLSLICSNLAQYGLNLLIFVAFYLFYVGVQGITIHPSAVLILWPAILAYAALTGLGIGLWLSALTVKYRDLTFALPLISQVWMFATPIVYPASSVVSAKWKWLLVVNPMSGVVELNRYAFLGAGTLDKWFMIPSMLCGIILLITGVLMFNRVQRTFIDTV